MFFFRHYTKSYFKRCHVVGTVECFKDGIREIIERHTTIKRWAYILHDQDDLKPHYHIYLDFGLSAVSADQIANWFGVKESQIDPVKGRVSDLILSFASGNHCSEKNNHYLLNDVVSNFNFGIEIANDLVLGDFENYSYSQQLEYVNSLPEPERSEAKRHLKRLWEMYRQYKDI